MNNKEENIYQKDEHRVHYIAYHLIWSPKRRKPILVGAIAEDCAKHIKDKCSERGWKVLNISIQPDHVHLFVQSFPAVSAEIIVKECKGFSSYNLRNKYPETKKLPCLWTKSYFASTAGIVSSETIRKYIEAQSKN
jgi:putative transposase